jgi:hypothetical protein
MNNKNHGKIKEIPPFLTPLALPTRHIQYSDNVNDNTDNYFLLVNKTLLDCVCVTQTTVTHSLLNITICIFQYPFPVAFGMSATWKF